MKVHEGILPDDLVRRFPGWEGPDHTFKLDDYQVQFVGLEHFLAAASTLWPTVVEDGDMVFMEKAHDSWYIEQVHAHVGDDKKRMERWINARELLD